MNTRPALIAAIGSAALLIGAFFFQFVLDMPPCKLCIWQRYPHVTAVLIGAIIFLRPNAILAVLGALSTLITGSIGVYHVGVEQKWWQGPTSCTGGDFSTLSTEDLVEQLLATPVVRCDEIPWELLGISMAGWNAIISLGLFALWTTSAVRHIKALT